MTDRPSPGSAAEVAHADKPFFVYFAPGATHAPHHVPKDWADKYKGKFDGGWDKLRDETFARQKQLGVIPADATLTPRHKKSRVGMRCPEALKPVLRRQMEVYAGFMEYTDHHVGRLLDSLKDIDVFDDTLVYYIIGDNGASAEGTAARHVQRDDQLQRRRRLGDTRVHDGADRQIRRTGVIQPLRGRLGARNEHAVSVDQAGRVALGRYAQRHHHQLAEGIKGKGEMRSQFHHVIDVGPTLLEAAGVPQPLFVDGVQQQPIEGVSMLYSFNDAKAAERHETQYFEMFGNRGIYHKGWTAVTRHKRPGARRRKDPSASTTTCGSSTTPTRTGARRTTWPSRCPKSCTSCSVSG
jgi:arylsulfatase